MVGQGGSGEKKTAYFYKRTVIGDQASASGKIPCDPIFAKAIEISNLDIGERYQSLMKQRQPFVELYGKICTRRSDSRDQFINTSDDETEVPLDD